MTRHPPDTVDLRTHHGALVFSLPAATPEDTPGEALIATLGGAVAAQNASATSPGLVVALAGSYKFESAPGAPLEGEEAAYRTLAWTIRQSASPVVGAIVGDLSGAETALALLLDGLVMSSAATLLHPHRSHDVALVGGSTKRLALTIGSARASEFIMLGRRMSAEQATEWGIVSQMSPPDGVFDACLFLLKRLSTEWEGVVARREMLGPELVGSA